MSDRNSRIDKIRENDSKERSTLESLYRLSAFYNKEGHQELVDTIDEYIMATMDYTIWDYSKTDKQFNTLVSKVLSIGNNKEAAAMSSSAITSVKDMIEAREQTISLISDTLSSFEWILYGLLSFLVILPLILSNNGNLLSVSIITILSISVLLILLLLNKLDNLSWDAEARIIEPYQKTLEIIGKLRYYPEDLIKYGEVKNHKGKKYRIVSYPNGYPNFEGKIIKIIE